jgi:sodium-dependent phosphate cotransporter
MIVGMVGTGILPFESAVAMVMGANIGTSVTNIIVSMGHISRGDEFKRAFGGSLLHDFFNVCSVAVLLPIELQFGIVSKAARFLESIFSNSGGLEFGSPLSAVTKPVAKMLVHLTGDSAWLSALLAFVLLFIALHFIVKVLRSMVLSRVEKFFQRYVFRTPVLSFGLGIGLTATVQSSSITTSMVVPLLGAGVLNLEQIYPYLLGANIGTTITAFLASLVTGSHDAVAVAFAHLIFNIYGIALFWPLKRIPIFLSERMAELTTKSKLVPILYIVVVFFLIPGTFIYFSN